MVQTHKPSTLILMETKMSSHKEIIETLTFDHQLQATANSHLGGIVIIWKSDILNLEDISITYQEIHTMVQALSSFHNWLF